MSYISGVLLGLSLIIAIGAQNIWVLSQSMAGANRIAIAASCILCDAALIVLGVYAANEVKGWLPSVTPWLIYAGVFMLGYLSISAGIRAYKGQSGLKAKNAETQAWQVTLMQGFAISLLNPHVYLDTVVLLGSIGAIQNSPPQFAIGACTASIIWFGGLTAFAPKLRSWLSSVQRWRVFDGTIALVLSVMAVQLLRMV